LAKYSSVWGDSILGRRRFKGLNDRLCVHDPKGFEALVVEQGYLLLDFWWQSVELGHKTRRLGVALELLFSVVAGQKKADIDVNVGNLFWGDRYKLESVAFQVVEQFFLVHVI
jgi:hypothetical protein